MANKREGALGKILEFAGEVMHILKIFSSENPYNPLRQDFWTNWIFAIEEIDTSLEIFLNSGSAGNSKEVSETLVKSFDLLKFLSETSWFLISIGLDQWKNVTYLLFEMENFLI